MNSACAGYQNYLDFGQCYLPHPSASADNIDLGLNNSGYRAQPHPIIVNNLRVFLDIDECINDEDTNCSPNAVCNNKIGTYECVCKDGYRGNGTHCGQ